MEATMDVATRRRRTSVEHNMDFAVCVKTGRNDWKFALGYSRSSPPPLLPPLECVMYENFRYGRRDRMLHPQIMPDSGPWYPYIQRVLPHNNPAGPIIGLVFSRVFFKPVRDEFGTIDPALLDRVDVIWQAMRGDYLELASSSHHVARVPRTQQRVLDCLVKQIRTTVGSFARIGSLFTGVQSALSDVQAFVRYRRCLQFGSNEASPWEYDTIGGFSPHVAHVHRAYVDGCNAWWLTNTISETQQYLLNPTEAASWPLFDLHWEIDIFPLELQEAPSFPVASFSHPTNDGAATAGSVPNAAQLASRGRRSRSRSPRRGQSSHAQRRPSEPRNRSTVTPISSKQPQEYIGQFVDPSRQDSLDGAWHGRLSRVQEHAIKNIDSSVKRQQTLVTSIPQAHFKLAPTTVVPPPHMFSGNVKHMRMVVACWLAGEDLILARLLADPNCQGTVARRWRSFLDGKLHRTTRAPSAGPSVSNVPPGRQQTFSDELADFVPANVAEQSDDGNDSVFGRDTEFKNGFILIQDAAVLDLHGVKVDFARSFGKPVNEAEIYSWDPVVAWDCREVLARHHIYDLARFIHSVQKATDSLDQRLREVLAIWEGDYGNNGLVPNVGATNPLVSLDWPTRRAALIRFTYVMGLWPLSTPLGTMLEKLLEDGDQSRITEDAGRDFEAAVWCFYAQTFFDCRRYAPVLPVPIKVPREGLPWSRSS